MLDVTHILVSPYLFSFSGFFDCEPRTEIKATKSYLRTLGIVFFNLVRHLSKIIICHHVNIFQLNLVVHLFEGFSLTSNLLNSILVLDLFKSQ